MSESYTLSERLRNASVFCAALQRELKAAVELALAENDEQQDEDDDDG